VFVVTVLGVGGFIDDTHAETLEELKEELDSKRDLLKDAEAKISRFKEEIQLKKQEARTLEDQIDIINDNVSQIELNLVRTAAEIATTDIEIKTIIKDIEEREQEIDHQKDLLGEYLRSLYELNQQSSVTIFLKYTTFSEAVNETATLQELQDRSRDTLISIKQLKEELEQKRSSLEDFRETLEKLRVRQEQQQATLVASRESKAHILNLTREQEAEYNSLLASSRDAHKAADAEIKRLDAAIREELKSRGADKLPSIGVLDWPVEAIFGISCGFHCAGYPYEYLIGPHSGIDIPTYVGTPIRAPADGYVGRVRNANGPGYSYILLLHGDNVSTVYGHVSGFAVAEGELVTRGTVIGYTGGAPGTTGAGLSSGPHLHLEVRVNNSAVDPQQYL